MTGSSGSQSVVHGCTTTSAVAATTHINNMSLPPQHIIQSMLIMSSQANPSIVLPTFHSQTQISRTRRKNNKQMKMVREMTQEELVSADTWAWRKYGQKPIKGSPYPRNYYRCSTWKGCTARKQVERSQSNPSIFMVTYMGEHTHGTRPIINHRSFDSGNINTQNNFFPTHNPISYNPSSETQTPHDVTTIYKYCKPASCSSSMVADNVSLINHMYTKKENIVFEDEDKEMVVGSENYEDIMIPNMVMAEDILKGFQELRRSGK